VQDPIELTVKGIPKEFVAKLHLHPDHPEKGNREYTIRPEKESGEAKFGVSRKDVNTAKIGNMIRLMELFNIKIERANVYSADATFSSETYEEAKQLKAQLIHWIPVGEDMSCQVVLQDATIVEGIAEVFCKRLKPNTIIQFERFGFVRIDKVDRKLVAYYAHK
jgi:glutamyl-tRNA synthetase